MLARAETLLLEAWVAVGSSLQQTLAGDASDGYSGVPGIGVKRADALLTSQGCTWDTVVNAFAEKDLGEDVALLNARLAEILQTENYVNGEIKLWQPPTTTSDGADN